MSPALYLTAIAAILATSIINTETRAVNVTNSWVLPLEGSPVFYRFFRDQITWLEADAVCQFHHGNLVAVETVDQFDSTKSLLKELDVRKKVWIGLQQKTPGGTFMWRDNNDLQDESSHWLEEIPKTSEPLCVAVDPAADFRWRTFYCDGPNVASFICELPVPPWIMRNDSCLINSLSALPALTAIYLPEEGAVELISDCGPQGTQRVTCKGQENRDEILSLLSCKNDNDATTSRQTLTSESTPPQTSSIVPSEAHPNHSKASMSITDIPESKPQTQTTPKLASEEKGNSVGPRSENSILPTRHRRETISQVTHVLDLTNSDKFTMDTEETFKGSKEKISSEITTTPFSSSLPQESINDASLAPYITEWPMNSHPSRKSNQINSHTSRNVQAVTSYSMETLNFKTVTDVSTNVMITTEKSQTSQKIEQLDLWSEPITKVSTEQNEATRREMKTTKSPSEEIPDTTWVFPTKAPFIEESSPLRKAEKLIKEANKLTMSTNPYPLETSSMQPDHTTLIIETTTDNKIKSSPQPTVTSDIPSTTKTFITSNRTMENKQVTLHMMSQSTGIHAADEKLSPSTQPNVQTELTTVSKDVQNVSKVQEADTKLAMNREPDNHMDSSEIRRRQFLPAPLRAIPAQPENENEVANEENSIDDDDDDENNSSTTQTEWHQVTKDPLAGEDDEIPRPNRNRKLTRSQGRSFYNYFLNRVLG